MSDQHDPARLRSARAAQASGVDDRAGTGSARAGRIQLDHDAGNAQALPGGRGVGSSRGLRAARNRSPSARGSSAGLSDDEAADLTRALTGRRIRVSAAAAPQNSIPQAGVPGSDPHNGDPTQQDILERTLAALQALQGCVASLVAGGLAPRGAAASRASQPQTGSSAGNPAQSRSLADLIGQRPASRKRRGCIYEYKLIYLSSVNETSKIQVCAVCQSYVVARYQDILPNSTVWVPTTDAYTGVSVSN